MAELPELEPAQRGHLEEGLIMYVRGRKVVVAEVHYPIVFWRYFDEDVIKHRSILTSPEMFQVPKGTPLMPTRVSAESSIEEFSDTDSDDEETFGVFDSNFVDGGFDMSDYYDDTESPVAVEDSTLKSLKSNLLESFASATPKFVVYGQKGTEEELLQCPIDAIAPQGIVIEKCSFAEFIVTEKVSHIMVTDCHSIQIRFVGVISGLDILRCTSCSFLTSGRVPSMSTESSQSIELGFPKKSNDVSIVVRATRGFNICAFESIESMEEDSEIQGTNTHYPVDDAITKLIAEHPALDFSSNAVEVSTKYLVEDQSFSSRVVRRSEEGLVKVDVSS